MDRTAAFVFTDPADAYAARTGRPNDLGVIGVALFRERESHVVAREPADVAPDYPSRSENAAEAPSAKADGELTTAQRSASIGTGHGRSEHSPAQWTNFERASD